MMKDLDIASNKEKQICIIDNYSVGFPTDRISRLETIIQESIPKGRYTTFHYLEIDNSILTKYAGFILSGSNLNVSEFYKNGSLKDGFEQELDLIKKAKFKPLLAICFGFHLTAYAFNGIVKRMNFDIGGSKIIPLNFELTDDLIHNDKLFVEVHHQDYVSPDDSNIQKSFKILATAKRNGDSTIQYMTHLEYPIFALQFHPETHYSNFYYLDNYEEDIIEKTMSAGEEIINNFISHFIL